MKHTIILPDLGQTTNEAKVLRWLKKPGERVSTGEPLLEVETDKAIMDVEAYVGGYLRKMMVAVGEMATAKEPIAILTDMLDEFYEDPIEIVAEAPIISAPSGAEQATPTVVLRAVAAVPAARALAKDLGIDLNLVTGTGPNGLITRNDVERFADGEASSLRVRVP